MLKVIGTVFAAAVIAILVMAMRKPATFHVERSTTVAATPDKIKPMVDDFHNWDKWSPWAKLDPTMQVTYGGAFAGEGATYEWAGNSKVGKGRMEVLSAQPTQTSIKLDFLEPFESHDVTNFVLERDGSNTRVRWTLDGPNTFTGKVISVFVSMDKIVGRDLERGLANLKTVAES